MRLTSMLVSLQIQEPIIWTGQTGYLYLDKNKLPGTDQSVVKNRIRRNKHKMQKLFQFPKHHRGSSSIGGACQALQDLTANFCHLSEATSQNSSAYEVYLSLLSNPLTQWLAAGPEGSSGDCNIQQSPRTTAFSVGTKSLRYSSCSTLQIQFNVLPSEAFKG